MFIVPERRACATVEQRESYLAVCPVRSFRFVKHDGLPARKFVKRGIRHAAVLYSNDTVNYKFRLVFARTVVGVAACQPAWNVSNVFAYCSLIACLKVAARILTTNGDRQTEVVGKLFVTIHFRRVT